MPGPRPSLPKSMFFAVIVVTLNQLRDVLGILAFIEAGLEDGLVLEVAEAQQVNGAELAVVAQVQKVGSRTK